MLQCYAVAGSGCAWGAGGSCQVVLGCRCTRGADRYAVLRRSQGKSVLCVCRLSCAKAISLFASGCVVRCLPGAECGCQVGQLRLNATLCSAGGE